MQSCVEGSSDWSSCTGFAHQLSHHLPLPWRQGCVRAGGSRISRLFFKDLYLFILFFPLSSYIKAAVNPYSLPWLCVLPPPSLEVKAPSQGIHPWAMTGAWREESFLHQPSRGWSEMRSALGNLSILSVSWSVWITFQRWAHAHSPTHSFSCTETVIGKTIKNNSHLSNRLHTMAAMAAAGMHICSRVFLPILINGSV